MREVCSRQAYFNTIAKLLLVQIKPGTSRQLQMATVLRGERGCCRCAVPVSLPAIVALLLGCKVCKLSGQLGFRFGTWNYVMVSVNLIS